MKLKTNFEVDVSLLVIFTFSLIAISLSNFAALYHIDTSMLLPSVCSGAFSAVLGHARIKYGQIVFINNVRMTICFVVALISNVTIGAISFVMLQHAGFF